MSESDVVSVLASVIRQVATSATPADETLIIQAAQGFMQELVNHGWVCRVEVVDKTNRKVRVTQTNVRETATLMLELS